MMSVLERTVSGKTQHYMSECELTRYNGEIVGDWTDISVCVSSDAEIEINKGPGQK